MDKTFNLTTAQETNALVPANTALAIPAQQTSAPNNIPVASEQEQTPATTPIDEKKQEKKKKHRNVEHCKVDFQKKKIILTKEFAKQASIIDTPEFNRLSELCQAYPHLKVITRKAKKSTTRPSMKGLTEAFMHNHIAIRYPNDWMIYQRQIAISKSTKSPHMYMRKWFVERYPNWNDYVVLPDTATNT